MSDIGAENLTVGDKAELEQVKAAVEQQLADNGAGYSDEERAQLEERLEEITDYIKTIENAETAPEAILALPDSVSEDDAETAAQINAAKDLYEADRRRKSAR